MSASDVACLRRRCRASSRIGDILRKLPDDDARRVLAGWCIIYNPINLEKKRRVGRRNVRR